MIYLVYTGIVCSMFQYSCPYFVDCVVYLFLSAPKVNVLVLWQQSFVEPGKSNATEDLGNSSRGSDPHYIRSPDPPLVEPYKLWEIFSIVATFVNACNPAFDMAVGSRSRSATYEIKPIQISIVATLQTYKSKLHPTIINRCADEVNRRDGIKHTFNGIRTQTRIKRELQLNQPKKPP